MKKIARSLRGGKVSVKVSVKVAVKVFVKVAVHFNSVHLIITLIYILQAVAYTKWQSWYRTDLQIRRVMKWALTKLIKNKTK